MGSVAVLGLGLMGGSLARELAAAGERVLGFDRDPETLRAAVEAGVVATPLDASLAGVSGAELVVLAVPVSAAPELLRRLLPRLSAQAVVTDVGSTKRAVVRSAEAAGAGSRFVGSHPLAGDHRSGWPASRPGLYRGARVYLTPTAFTGGTAVRRVAAFWESLGAEPQVIDPAEHDRLLAWTSHLPQAVASATAIALFQAGVRRQDLGPGGRDVTRLAASSPEMWGAISLDNADVLAEAVAAIEAELSRFRAAVQAGDAPALQRFFSTACEWAREG